MRPCSRMTSLAVAKGTGYLMPAVQVGISTPNFIVQLPSCLDLLIKPSTDNGPAPPSTRAARHAR